MPIYEGIDEDDPVKSEIKEPNPVKYVVSYLEEDQHVIFKCLKEYSVMGVFTLKGMSNPFKVCQGCGDSNCIDKVDDYTFKNNEEYTIYVQIEKIKTKVWGIEVTYNVLTGFSFYGKKLSNGKFLRF